MDVLAPGQLQEAETTLVQGWGQGCDSASPRRTCPCRARWQWTDRPLNGETIERAGWAERRQTRATVPDRAPREQLRQEIG